MGNGDAPLVWLTNLAAPYRLPLWDAIAERHPLEVWFTSRGEPNRRWSVPEENSHAFRPFQMRTLKVTLPGTEKHLYFGRTVALLRARRPSALVVAGWETPIYQSALRWAYRQGVPHVIWTVSTLGSRTVRRGPADRVRSRTFRSADGVIAASDAASRAVIDMGVPAARVTKTFNPVEVGRFAQLADFTPPVTPHRFLFVGQLIERKNVESLLRALVDVPGTLDVVGEGPLRSNLEALAWRLGVGGRVAWHGHLDVIADPTIYGRVHTLVLPSLQEAWGLVANEALAAGRHVVVSTQAGCSTDLADMPGVFLSAVTPAALGAAMSDSAAQWVGPIGDHPILGRTPDAAAADVLRSLANAGWS